MRGDSALPALACFLATAAILFDPSSPFPERLAFASACASLVPAVMLETGRSVTGSPRTRTESVADVLGVTSFIAFLSLYLFRVLFLS